ncbi:MAG: hypothetical protein A3H28_17185 [Acidobacteria bacterium RIFCSPLOWO2_02_FULL_61_28]|nr:MAG: hypothetical protein A3H28_17185 [Acidobacteria bacterium RIFCSPLOWO2_02_FULL_61_28]
MRHRPHEQALRKVLPWLAAEKLDLFSAYQQTQSEMAEQVLTQAEYLASFIGHEPGEALFVGLYKVGRSHSLTFNQFWKVRSFRELGKLGMMGFVKGTRHSCLWFDLQLTEIYQEWRGKLIIGWPPPERAWCRWANRNEFPVKAILPESLLVREMPPAEELTLAWNELKNLPSSWKSALAQWRGVYFILDRSDGKSYVGSAYGRDNIYSRWSNYAARGHGGNKQLRGRKPENFLFSILERVSPDMVPEEVIQKENHWKKRLHTREFGLNDN